MKRSIFILLIMICSIHSLAQIKINFHNSWGTNLVNLEDATGSPMFDDGLPVNTRQLVDWDRFFYNGELQVLKSINDNVDLGLVIGMNRLYYWEERYRNFNQTSFSFDYGTIWTYELSGMVNYNIEESWFLQGAIGAHLFEIDDSATVGLAAGVGYNLPINDKLLIPIVLKTDFIFGDGTTIAPNLGLGVTLLL